MDSIKGVSLLLLFGCVVCGASLHPLCDLLYDEMLSPEEANELWQQCEKLLDALRSRWEVGSSPICFEGSFESQVRSLLSSQMLTRSEIRNLSTVFSDLQETMRRRWPGSEVIPIGSVTTGLVMKSSDTDCMVNVPYYNVYNETANKYLLLQAVRQLRQQPELYSNVRAKFRPYNKPALLMFNHIPTQRPCDVSFITEQGLRISRMIAGYYSLDDRVRRFAAVLKFLFKVPNHHHTILDSYSQNLLIIFYFQQENILPPLYLLRTALHQRLSGEKNYRIHNSKTIYQLLGGFFKYYSEFDFENYVISPVLGRSLHKREFEDVDSLPSKLSQYKNYMRIPGSMPIALNTTMCVQDAISQHINVMEHTPLHYINTFMAYVKFAAIMYRHLPSDRFLRTISHCL